jgi:hypothetical protein
MDDSFIASYIGDLLRALRTQYLITLIKPYSRLDMSFLSKQLNVGKPEVEEILIGLILEGKIEGRIDQVAQRVELDRQCVSFYTPPIDSLVRVTDYKRGFTANPLRSAGTWHSNSGLPLWRTSIMLSSTSLRRVDIRGAWVTLGITKAVMVVPDGSLMRSLVLSGA